ncbi:Uncharacterised protein [Achromobacter xylosoxidans]|nr:Uncharacterised protein [Achromobacter xylosoxidans]
MKIYAEIGESHQRVGGDCPPGWILMDGERPGDHHIAAEDGTWVERPAFPPPVSRYQGREAMRLTPYPKEGRPDWTLFDAFEELLNDPATPAYYRRAWDELQAFEWGSAMLHAAADVLGLTLAQRLDLFGLAATLKA